MKPIIILLSLAGLSWMALAEEEATVVKKATVSVTQTTVSKDTAPVPVVQTAKPSLTSSGLSQAHHQATGLSVIANKRDTTGFFSLSVGHEAKPLHYFEYDSTTFNLRYGGYFSEQSSFEAGIKMAISRIPGIMVKYNYDFIKNSKWIPGLDIALSVEPSFRSEHRRNKIWLDAGLAIGPYIKTSVSRSHVLFLRTGIAYDTSSIDSGISPMDLRIYLNLGIQWHF